MSLPEHEHELLGHHPVAVQLDRPIRTVPNVAPAWGASQHTVNTANPASPGQVAGPVRIVAADPARLSATIRNLSTTATVYLAPTQGGCTATSAFPLLPGESYEHPCTADVFAIASADGVAVAVADLRR